jgi:short-subunit dehydrogenase
MVSMGKRIVITGCSSGIGRALATELSRRGHHVIATARRVETLVDLPVAERVALDITSEDSVAAAAAAADDIDVLVNNAGISIWSAVEGPNEAEVQRIFETNVFGMLRTLRAFLPRMRARRRGDIYQVSSTVAKRSTALVSHYAATKAAFDAYSEALRLELAPFGIGVSIVVLGAVASDFGLNRRDIVTPGYEDMIERVSNVLGAHNSNRASVESVAMRIADAIDTGKPPLRIEGTPGAFKMYAQRASQTDEEWEKSSLERIWG